MVHQEFPSLQGGTVFAYCGQGVQAAGMAAGLETNAAAQEVFTCASDVFGFDVLARMNTTTQEELNQTLNAQPALCALQVAQTHALAAKGVKPSAVLGFSLGQIAALEAAGMLSIQATFALCARRAELMDAAAHEYPGAMAATLKLNVATVEQLAGEAGAATGKTLVAANYNCAGQTVVSGELEALDYYEGLVAQHKGKVVRLATSGAFHSPLMAHAAEELRNYMQLNCTFAEPAIPLIANDTASPLTAPRAVDALACHLTNPVRFQTSVEVLEQAGIATSVEIGVGTVLSKLIKRIAPGITRTTAKELLKQ